MDDSAAPLISVVVPVYRTQPYLRTCLDSILLQTERRIEVVVVDDGSFDDCPRICDEYARRDRRVRVIHQSHAGRSAARNAAIAVARGMWIGFVDSDDWIEADMYAALLAAAWEHDAQIAVCGRFEESFFSEWDSKTIAVGSAPLSSREALGLLVQDETMRSYLCDKLFRRELFEGLSFPLGRDFEDVAMVYRLFYRALRVARVDAPYYHYIFHGDNLVLSKRLSKHIDYWLAARERYDFLVDRCPELREQLELDVMRSHLVCWSIAWHARGEDAASFEAHRVEMARFAREHYGCLLRDVTLGRVGRLCARLTVYPGHWSVFLIMVLNKIRSVRHGETRRDD